MYVYYLAALLILCENVHGIPSPRIVGGQPANISDYPYQVSVQSKGKHKCGGSILTKKFILSAAHCIFDEQETDLKIRAGSSYHASGGQLIQVAKINQHPNFNADTFVYDIAVLQLSYDLQLGAAVAKIAMISSNGIVNEGVLTVATGWGQLSENGPVPNQLQVVSLPAIQTANCIVKYYGDIIDNTMFCAGYPQGLKDTCQGDSGGPLVYNRILVGITSWGFYCGQPNSPGVFTKLSVLRAYVDSIIK